MDKYRKGARRERQAKKILEEQGWKVKKSLLSRGVFDLFAFKGLDTLLVQVTSNHKPSPAKMEKIKDYEVYPNTKKEVWVFYDKDPVPRIIRI